MAGQYSPKNFYRQAPKQLLREYFAKKGIGHDIPWETLPDADVEPIFKAIEAAPLMVQTEIDTELREIVALADEGGIRTLIEEGRDPHHRIDLAPIFEGMESMLACALWTFLNHHDDIFEVARRFDYADGQTFHKRPYLPHVEAIPTEESTERLQQALSEYYRREEGRGQGCQVDNYRRGDQYYYFCYLEDYGENRPGFDEEHRFKREKMRPAFEVILIYEPLEQTLESKVMGGRQVRSEIERIFGRTVLGVDLGAPPDLGAAYDLSGLLHRDFEFAIDPSDGIEQVALRRLKFRIMGREYRSITLEVGANAPVKAIWDLYDEVLANNRITKDLLTVLHARIRIVFRPDTKGRSPKRTFTVSHPNSCSLKCDPKDEIAKACLKRWKLDVSGRDDYRAPEPRLDAQYRLWS